MLLRFVFAIALACSSVGVYSLPISQGLDRAGLQRRSVEFQVLEPRAQTQEQLLKSRKACYRIVIDTNGAPNLAAAAEFLGLRGVEELAGRYRHILDNAELTPQGYSYAFRDYLSLRQGQAIVFHHDRQHRGSSSTQHHNVETSFRPGHEVGSETPRRSRSSSRSGSTPYSQRGRNSHQPASSMHAVSVPESNNNPDQVQHGVPSTATAQHHDTQAASHGSILDPRPYDSQLPPVDHLHFPPPGAQSGGSGQGSSVHRLRLPQDSTLLSSTGGSQGLPYAQLDPYYPRHRRHYQGQHGGHPGQAPDFYGSGDREEVAHNVPHNSGRRPRPGDGPPLPSSLTHIRDPSPDSGNAPYGSDLGQVADTHSYSGERPGSSMPAFHHQYPPRGPPFPAFGSVHDDPSDRTGRNYGVQDPGAQQGTNIPRASDLVGQAHPGQVPDNPLLPGFTVAPAVTPPLGSPPPPDDRFRVVHSP